MRPWKAPSRATTRRPSSVWRKARRRAFSFASAPLLTRNARVSPSGPKRTSRPAARARTASGTELLWKNSSSAWSSQRRQQPRMPVAEQRHRVAAVEIDQRAAVARMDDHPLAPHRLDGRVRIDGQQPAGLVQLGLENGFDGGLGHVSLLYSHPSPGTVNPAVSGNPSSRFIHWIAPPAAPFTRLSIAEKTTR